MTFLVGLFHSESGFHFPEGIFGASGRFPVCVSGTLIEVVELIVEGTDIAVVLENFFSLGKILIVEIDSQTIASHYDFS